MHALDPLQGGQMLLRHYYWVKSMLVAIRIVPSLLCSGTYVTVNPIIVLC